MVRYAYNLRGLYETPAAHALDDDEALARARETARRLIEEARREGRTVLTELDSKRVLEAYGIPTVRTEVAMTADEAVEAAERIGYPVVVKLHSRAITHKTEVGGVKLGLSDARAVKKAFDEIHEAVAGRVGEAAFDGVTVQTMVDRSDAYELIVGSSIDPQFGPVILFGMGGQLVEVFRDRAVGLPPLNRTLARRMMEQTRIYEALRGVRGRAAVDFAALETLLVRFAELVLDHPEVAEIDINPLLVSARAMVALDARVLVHPQDADLSKLPRPAIRPYPLQYAEPWTTSDGMQVLVRPIRPEDEPLMVDFHQQLSERSVRLRYLVPMALDARVAHERLVRVCFVDYDRDIALVALRTDPETGKREILAVGRLAKLPGTDEAEFAILVADAWQGRGLGTELLQRLIGIAKKEGLAKLSAEMLSENVEMQRVCAKLGFRLEQLAGASVVQAELDLRTAPKAEAEAEISTAPE